MKKAGERESNIIQEYAYVRVVATGYLKGSSYIYAVMLLFSILEVRIAFREFATRIVWDTAQYIDVAALINQKVTNIINAKRFRPKVLANNQDFLFFDRLIFQTSAFSRRIG